MKTRILIVPLILLSLSLYAQTISDVSTGPPPASFFTQTTIEDVEAFNTACDGIPCYATDHTSNAFIYFNANNVNGYRTNNLSLRFIPGADFMEWGDYQTLYGVTYYSNEFVELHTQSGGISVIGPCTPLDTPWELWTGLTITPNGTIYACAAGTGESKLYRIDQFTGSPFFMGVVSNAPTLIDIAANSRGELYALDLSYDQLLYIDPFAPTGSVIGYIGFDANHSQGMDFDQRTDKLYLAAFNETEGRAEMRIADLTTGNTTLIAPVPSSLYKLDSLAIATSPPRYSYPPALCYGPGATPYVLRCFKTDNPGMVHAHDTTVPFLPGADFLNNDYSTLYCVSYYSNTFSTLTTDDVYTVIGPCTPVGTFHMWTGVAGAPDGTLYATSTDTLTSDLYTIDPITGVPTLVGGINDAPAIIDIAVSASGDMYGFDLLHDIMVKIDPATAHATVLGSIGYNANYSQGMDFDESSGILYLAALNGNTTRSELRIADTNTGYTTFLGQLGKSTFCCSDMGIIADAQSAIKITSLKVKDKGAGQSSFTLKAGYNWNGRMPPDTLIITVGDYSSGPLSVTPKGKKYVFSSSELSGTLAPQSHSCKIKVRNIDPPGTAPNVNIRFINNETYYYQSRNVTLDSKGSYKENDDLAVPLVYIDKASVKDKAKDNKDAFSLDATIHGSGPASADSFFISVTGENGVIFTQTIAAAEFTSKNGKYLYKRPKNAITPIQKIQISTDKKTVKLKAKDFNMSPNAIGMVIDPKVTIELRIDVGTLNCAGTISTRFIQKAQGKAKF